MAFGVLNANFSGFKNSKRSTPQGSSLSGPKKRPEALEMDEQMSPRAPKGLWSCRDVIDHQLLGIRNIILITSTYTIILLVLQIGNEGMIRHNYQ